VVCVELVSQKVQVPGGTEENTRSLNKDSWVSDLRFKPWPSWIRSRNVMSENLAFT
jgi:hypothetical protein